MRKYLYHFLLLVLAVVGWLVFMTQPAPAPAEHVSVKTRTERVIEKPAAPAVEVEESYVEENAAPPEEKKFIKRVISSRWIDAPGKLAGRQRVRIVEADFKYPFYG